jgi:ATP-dependent protease ClpP protease subunit
MTKTLIRMLQANKGRGSFRAENNVLWLYDVIASDRFEASWWGGIAPEDFIAALRACDGPVTLRINSPGGSVFGAQAMVAEMRNFPHAITAHVDALAASAASVIAANCASCVMVPGSMLMIHKAWSCVCGDADDMRDLADLLDKIDGLIAETYAGRSDASREEYLALMQAETWFTPEEAVAQGLADAIDDTNTQRSAAARALAGWDLSAFEHAPVPDAAEPDPVAGPGLAVEEAAAPIEETVEQVPAELPEARERRVRITTARTLAHTI